MTRLWLLNMVNSVDPASDITTEVEIWLEQNWDPDLTVREWWELLGTAGWSAPTLSVEWFGRGASREEGIRVVQTIAAAGVLGAPRGEAQGHSAFGRLVDDDQKFARTCG